MKEGLPITDEGRRAHQMIVEAAMAELIVRGHQSVMTDTAARLADNDTSCMDEGFSIRTIARLGQVSQEEVV